MAIDLIAWFFANLGNIIVWGIVLFLVGFFAFQNKVFVKKVKDESISFIALILSISLGLIGFFTEPDAISSGTLSIFSEGTVKIIFPIVLIALIGALISLYFFLRRK